MDNQDRELEEALQAELGTMRAPEDLKERTLAAMKTARDESSLAQTSARAKQDQVITIPKAKARRGQRRRLSARLVAALVACCCLLFVGGGGTYVYATPTAYVGLGSDQLASNNTPSDQTAQAESGFIELGLNRFNRVIEATAANDQAQAILDASSVNHKDYAEAVSELLAQAQAQGIFVNGDIVAVSIACDNATQGTGLAETSEACVNAAGCRGKATQTSMSEHTHARDGSGSGSGSGNGAGNGSGSGNGAGNGSGSGNGAGNGSGVGTASDHAGDANGAGHQGKHADS